MLRVFCFFIFYFYHNEELFFGSEPDFASE